MAAYGVLMNLNFTFTAVFWGYNVGVSPLISFQYGSQNQKELHNLFKKSMILILLSSLSMCLIAELLADPIASLFVGYDPALMKLTRRGFLIFSLSFLFAGLSIFGSSLFTALSNGLLSAILSFSRTFVFQIGSILILPLFLGVDGIWLSLVVAEFFTMVTGILFIAANRKKYRY